MVAPRIFLSNFSWGHTLDCFVAFFQSEDLLGMNLFNYLFLLFVFVFFLVYDTINSQQETRECC